MLPVSGLNPTISGLNDLFSGSTSGENNLFNQLFGVIFSSDLSVDELNETMPEGFISLIQQIVEPGNTLPLSAPALPLTETQLDHFKQILTNFSGQTQATVANNLPITLTPAASELLDEAAFTAQQLKTDIKEFKGQMETLADNLKMLLANNNAKTSVGTPIVDSQNFTGTSNSGSSFLANLNSIFSANMGTQDIELPIRVGEPGWDKSLSSKMLLLFGRDQQSIEMKLNPAKLGPLEVRLSMQQDQANITFLSSHATVREAVELALPRLREMLSSNDIQLASAQVSDHPAKDNKQGFNMEGDTQAGSGHHTNNGQSAETDEDRSENSIQVRSTSLLDAYA